MLVFVTFGRHCIHDMVLGPGKWPRFVSNDFFLLSSNDLQAL
jgi:hypothetical protein